MADLERIYTVPLGDAYSYTRTKRSRRAVSLLRAFIKKHMKAEGRRILVSTALNESIWQRGMQKPPRRVKIRAIKDAESVRVYLHDEKIEPKKKPAEKKDEVKPKADARKEPAGESPKEHGAEPPKAAKAPEQPHARREQTPAPAQHAQPAHTGTQVHKAPQAESKK